MLTTADVTFEPKSPWQKDDCIGGCGDPATIEAVASDGGETTSRVRCCTKQRCKDIAAEFALVPFRE